MGVRAIALELGRAASTVFRKLRRLGGDLLAQRSSPARTRRHLRARFPDDRSVWLCHESIYQVVDQLESTLVLPPEVASMHLAPLRTGRDHRWAHQRGDQRRLRSEQPMLAIRDRPFAPEDRSQPGHWEAT